MYVVVQDSTSCWRDYGFRAEGLLSSGLCVKKQINSVRTVSLHFLEHRIKHEGTSLHMRAQCRSFRLVCEYFMFLICVVT